MCQDTGPLKKFEPLPEPEYSGFFGWPSGPNGPFLGTVSPADKGSGSASNPAGHREALETEKEVV